MVRFKERLVIVKISFWTYISDNCDGSATVNFFRSEANAKKYANHDDQKFTDAIDHHELEFDRHGILMDEDVHPEDEEELLD